jgi:hypothetical protein
MSDDIDPNHIKTNLHPIADPRSAAAVRSVIEAAARMLLESRTPRLPERGAMAKNPSEAYRDDLQHS